MKKKITAVILFLIVTAAYNSFAAGGHDQGSSANEFRIGSADISLKMEPATYMEGKTPDVVLSLKDSMSGSPVYDAEVYIYLEEEKTTDHSAHQMASAPPEGTRDGSLDFGSMFDMPPMSMATNLSMFKKLQPQEMAGMYLVSYALPGKGMYKFTLAVKSLQGKNYAEPLIYGGRISYSESSRAPFFRMLFIIGAIILSGIIGMWIIFQRLALKTAPGQKLNILDIPWVKKFFKSAWFQPVFQIPTLLIFLVVIFTGIFDIQQGDKNIATLLTWTIWWAAIIFTFVLIGRIWCMMCPFGAIQDWIGRLISMNRDFPKPLRNIYLSSTLFLALTWWDSYSGIVNKPALTAYLFIGFFVVATGMALVFKGRSFCRYVCPIGGLISIYSMFSPIELRNKGLEVCRSHKTKECIKGTDKSHGCPMFVTPMTLDRNNNCNFCSECIKSCSQDNIVIRFRSFAKDLWVSSKGYLDEALLVIALVGITIIITGEMVEPWHRWMDAVGKILPFDMLGIMSHTVREKATFLFVFTVGSLVVAPLLLLASSLAVRKFTGPEPPLSLKQTFVQFAYMFIPVGLSMHLAHNINHLFKEGPGIVPAVERITNNIAGTGTPDWSITPLMGSETIFWFQMAIFLVMNIFSLYAGYRIAVKYYGDKALRAFIPMALLAVSLMVLNAYILGQPMSMRHHH